MRIQLYDTTLRDGTQREGLSLSAEDKVKIARELDRLGVHYIEGGWPGSNPKDAAFFERDRPTCRCSTRGSPPLAAPGAPRRTCAERRQHPGAGRRADAGGHAGRQKLDPPCGAGAGNDAGRKPGDDRATASPIFKRRGKEVVYDAEHFFDGYRLDPAYALATLRAAADAGADWLVLCDTNGGSAARSTWRGSCAWSRARRSPRRSASTPTTTARWPWRTRWPPCRPGRRQVQGTINGYGERCGNMDLIPLIANLQLKLRLPCLAPEQLPG